MAIRAAFTKPKTGGAHPNAHIVVHDPILRSETRQVVLRVSVYASKADYDAGKEPEQALERVLPVGYAALRTACLDLIEPALITRFFPGGTRVPD